jgi:hypothetical protein
MVAEHTRRMQTGQMPDYGAVLTQSSQSWRIGVFARTTWQRENQQKTALSSRFDLPRSKRAVLT